MAGARPLDTMFQTLLGGGRTRNPSPTKTLGHMGTAIYGGHVVSNEKDNSLSDQERFRTFSNILANCSVAAAGVRYFLNLTARADWAFDPAEHPEGERYADLIEGMLTEDPATSWSRIIRRAAMYRFYGFSVQEWTARRREDGLLTLMDVAPRPQMTIERWDVNTDGTVNGVTQRNPQNQQETYLPRSKLLYMVDDSLSDSPEGLGLFRHIVEPARRLARYEQLEAFGFETDLRGVPVGRAPYAELRQAVKDGTITEADAKAAVAPLERFVEKHVKNPELGLLIDSEVFTTTDERTAPSGQSKFDLSLLDGSSTALPDMARAIDRLNREIARVLGVEAIILGDGDAGSHALSKDKTNQFSLTVDSTLEELADTLRDDLMRPLFRLNGWDEEAMPTMKPEAAQYKDVDQITQALRDMAQAGAVLEPDDPAINDVRALLGIEPIDNLTRDEDAAIGHNGGPPLDDDEVPERPEEEGTEE